MITDEERREVAEKMRGYDVSEFKESAIVPFLDCLGVGYLNWREVLDSLADLIDRPTCRLVLTDTETHGKAKVRCYECSECGGACEEIYGKYERCPHCGCVVVEDD